MAFFKRLFRKRNPYADLDLDDFKSSLDADLPGTSKSVDSKSPYDSSGSSTQTPELGNFYSRDYTNPESQIGSQQGFSSGQHQGYGYYSQAQPQQNSQQSIQKEFEIINSKLEMLKVLLESINQRLYMLEKQNEKRRF
ncbi:MAG TPA: hypothetical protein ENN46_02725 [Candidatus Woesearchaeota archaeon]|nr:hypothetical protein [Candidatus Woesearchaeota archaeon]